MQGILSLESFFAFRDLGGRPSLFHNKIWKTHTCLVLYIQSPARARAPSMGTKTRKTQLILPPQLLGITYGCLRSRSTIVPPGDTRPRLGEGANSSQAAKHKGKKIVNEWLLLPRPESVKGRKTTQNSTFWQCGPGSWSAQHSKKKTFQRHFPSLIWKQSTSTSFHCGTLERKFLSCAWVLAEGTRCYVDNLFPTVDRVLWTTC